MTGGFGPSLGHSTFVDPSQWAGEARVLGPKWTHLPTLTIGLLGVQVFWSVEMAYASPYLLSLGLSTSHVALVFLAGPLSGLIVQPLIGAFADSSTSRWGRRRPYIIVGCILCIASMLLLGYTRAVAGLFTQYGSHANNVLTTILAVVSIFILDFSINAVQAVDRALLVDTLPPAEQTAGNACAALMLGFGSVVGFFVGNLPLRIMLPFLQAESELQALSVLVSVILLAFHILTASLVRERVLLKTAMMPRPSLINEFREIWAQARTLPRIIRQIVRPQVYLSPFKNSSFAWLGWFPVLFYTTMYISDLYLRSGAASVGATDAPLAAVIPSASPSVPTPLASAEPVDSAADTATRLGARAQLISALLALVTNAFLPFALPVPTDRRRRGMRNSQLMGRIDLDRVASGTGESMPYWRRLRVPNAVRVPLPTLWAASHAVFAVCMVGSFFTHSVATGTLLIACTGFSWGITQWAPFSLLGEAILTSPAPGLRDTGTMPMSIRLADARTTAAEEESFLVAGPGHDSDSESDSEIEFVRAEERHSGEDDGEDRREYGDTSGRKVNGNGQGLSKDEHTSPVTLLGNPRAQLSVMDVLTPRSAYTPHFDADGNTERGVGGDEFGVRAAEGIGGLSTKAGVILGIHNIFIVIPQFLVTGLASIIFAIFDGSGAPDPASSPQPGRNSVVYVFRIGAIWASIAFVLAWRLARELRRG
ncbi:MFS general substrate transporter [Mycena pura]|uniref:MFS general substrate transporter n=1 Tax=Mycena pura TaxID=153505 RepID=A0AAD6Y1K3_9AGAR|nr:MFS general substrate transporter [Mycena pura]